MGENSKIEWCDMTFNPWIGCTKVSPGCAHCYAENSTPTRVARKKGHELWGKGMPRQRTSEANWRQPLKWNDQAKAFNLAQEYLETCNPARAPRVFCASLADWLDDEVPIEWLADLLRLIHETPNLDWLLLTKRPENFKPRLQAVKEWLGKRVTGTNDRDIEWCYVADWLASGSGDQRASAPKPPQNVWIGATVENQQWADERIPHLLKIPARVRFLSCEPLLGPLRIKDALRCDVPIHWVICGGESGPKARPMHPDWARSLRDQCQAAGVAFFFKQWGEHQLCANVGAWSVLDAELERQIKQREVLSFGNPAFIKLGNKAAGRLLDGREWNEVPR